MKKYLPVLLFSVFFSTKSYTQNTVGVAIDPDAMNWQLSYDFMGMNKRVSQATCTGDVTPPVISCSQNLFVQATSSCGTYLYDYPYPSASDNCSNVSVQCNPPAWGYFLVGTNTITCTATDASNNSSSCTFDIFISENVPPTISCPQDIIYTQQGTNTTDCGAIVDYPYPSTTDNCSNPVVVCSMPPLSFFSTGTTTVTCTATDASNNTANCMFNVVVLETVPPTITCPADITTTTDPNNCNARVTWANPLVTDNCGSSYFTCTRPSGSYFSLGTSSVTCYGTDMSNNTSSCTFDVTVVDTEPPVISCLNDIVVVSDPGVCSATVTWSTPSVTDNCGVNTITSDLSSGSSFPVSTTTVTYIATDIFGNLSTCMFDVTVIDNEPAIIMCPDDIVVAPDPNTCDAVVSWANPVSGDCGGLMTFCNIQSGSTFSVGTTNVFCLITGASTTVSCEFDVTVTDCLANCPPIITLNNTTANGLYHAQNSVTATNTVTTANTAFKAGNCIELHNGFTASANADFSGEIEDCTPNFGQNGDQN